MITPNSTNDVLSQYNPLVLLKPNVGAKVEEDFLQPIAQRFFESKKGIENYDQLDAVKLKTDIDFVKEKNFVGNYLYPEVMQSVVKNENGKIEYKIKYVFTLDKDLTPKPEGGKNYPYSLIFNDNLPKGVKEGPIYYGRMCLGAEPVLYYIWIDFAVFLKFIKSLRI